jgi:hypothetical protein
MSAMYMGQLRHVVLHNAVVCYGRTGVCTHADDNNKHVCRYRVQFKWRLLFGVATSGYDMQSVWMFVVFRCAAQPCFSSRRQFKFCVFYFSVKKIHFFYVFS